MTYQPIFFQPIHRAADAGDVDALRRALASGVSPNALDSNDRTPLHYLLRKGDKMEARLTCLLILLEAGADIHAPTSKSQSTPFHYAAERSHANVIAALIKAGAELNRGNAFGETPLHWACLRDDSHVEPVLLLLRNGAAVNARTSQGHTPLDYALLQPRRRRLVPILLRAGAALPAHTTNAYLQKVIAAGGIDHYARNHLNALAKTFTPKLAHRLPKELVRIVVEYAFHVGDC